jgi:hypothetical protein
MTEKPADHSTTPQIEIAARALCKAAGSPENTRYNGGAMWESYIPEANAVLSALQLAGYIVFKPGKDDLSGGQFGGA